MEGNGGGKGFICEWIDLIISFTMLLYACQDLWKEWGDSNFKMLFTELPVSILCTFPILLQYTLHVKYINSYLYSLIWFRTLCTKLCLKKMNATIWVII